MLSDAAQYAVDMRDVRGQQAAKRALELRRANEAKSARPPSGRTANEGINPKSPPAYTLRHPAKAGAISQRNKNMQAKRDSR